MGSVGFAIITAFFLWDSACAADVLSDNSNSAVCTNCHGHNGNSVGPLEPILAGQNAEYIADQLKAFQSGKRKNSTMEKIARSLSKGDVTDLAAFFSNQTPISPGGDILLARIGKPIYSRCSGCHGQNAEGADGYPRLAGQHPQYIVAQLKNFKNGKRNNPAMRAIMALLSDEDIVALGAYLGSLSSK